jgi:uncharacterized protein YqhQ
MTQPFYYGGQAVIEGVMMRGKKSTAISVFRPDGTLDVYSQPLPGIYQGIGRKIPLVRGILVLAEALTLGTRSLFHSAKVASMEEEENIPSILIFGVVAVSLIFAVALFFVTPLLLTRYLDSFIASDLVSHIIEGLIRMTIFVIYLAVIGLFPDVRRVFGYHGAEHKVINAYEAGCPLIEEEVENFSTAHVRCGTSFLFTVMIIAILVFALSGRPSIWISILSRVILLPVIAAIGYEVTRLSARFSQNPVAKVMLAPGLLLQSLTTRKPDRNQLKAAISALNTVIEADANSHI